jgi:hypothetical protein
MNIFGYTITKNKKIGKLEAFQIESDPSSEVLGANAAGVMLYNYDLVTVPENEAELIRTYRRIAMSPDVDLALTEIRNEIFIFDVTGRRAIDLGFTNDSKLSESVKSKIVEEFVNLYSIIDFNNSGLSLFMDWYIDGKMFLHKVIDTSKPKEGIKKIIPIDPLKIKKIREVPIPDANGIYNAADVVEYYIYVDTPDGIGKASYAEINRGLKINPDAISYSDSGIYDKNSNTVLGHLYKAIVPFNNLRLMEDSLIVYRVSRAPERRVIYVDVGSLPKNKAEQYMRDLMNRFKNKLVYDSRTGSIVDRKNILSMIEDYWLPRRDGGRGTEITTLPGGENLGIVDDVTYFRNKLYQSLNVPVSRFQDDPPVFSFGKGTEINRDEYRFKKFIDRLRQRFMFLFEDLLKTQLLLKNVITEKDWDAIRRSLQWEYAEDNNFVEYKESEILNNRINTLTQIDPFVGKYFTKDWVLRNVLKFSDEEAKQVNKEFPSDQESPDSDRPENFRKSDDSEDLGDSENDNFPEKQNKEWQ